MSEYTPTTDEIREDYIWSRRPRQSAEVAAEFDRWLDQVKAEARREGQAEAWDECATESGYRGWMHNYAVTEMQERNPYRNGADQ